MPEGNCFRYGPLTLPDDAGTQQHLLVLAHVNRELSSIEARRLNMRKISLSIAIVSAWSLWRQSRPPQIESPEVGADRRITFRLYARRATSVVVTDLVNLGSNAAPLVLAKDTPTICQAKWC
jgi:hypothetical protein